MCPKCGSKSGRWPLPNEVCSDDETLWRLCLMCNEWFDADHCEKEVLKEYLLVCKSCTFYVILHQASDGVLFNWINDHYGAHLEDIPVMLALPYPASGEM